MTPRKLSFLCLLVFLTAGPLFGQAGASGTILGTITDSSGAVLPNAKVTITNTATNVNYNTETSSTGDYTVPELRPGNYKVSATASGFQTSVTQNFVLAVDQKVRIDMSLQPGAVTETNQLTAQAEQLDPDSAA